MERSDVARAETWVSVENCHCLCLALVRSKEGTAQQRLSLQLWGPELITGGIFCVPLKRSGCAENNVFKTTLLDSCGLNLCSSKLELGVVSVP